MDWGSSRSPAAAVDDESTDSPNSVTGPDGIVLGLR